MFKSLIIGSSIAAVGASALFVPLDPATLRILGLTNIHEDDVVGRQHGAKPAPARLKIVSGASGAPSSPYQRMDIKIVRAPRIEAAPNSRRTSAATSEHDVQARMNFASRARLLPPIRTISQTGRTVIARNLQTELRRIGCYKGRIDGDWGPASRYAMATFTKAVNAVLPTDTPDMVLLALVRRHVGTTCGSKARPFGTGTVQARAGSSKPSAWKVRVTQNPVPQVATRPAAPASLAGLVSPPRLVTSYNRPRIVSASGSLNRAGRVPTEATATGSAQRVPAPRVYSTNSATQTATITGGPVFERKNRMSLGAPIVPQQAAVRPPITSSPAPVARRSRSAARRPYVSRRKIKSRSRIRRNRSKRRSRKAWRNRVYSSINANGS